jgi:hypothetical protein
VSRPMSIVVQIEMYSYNFRKMSHNFFYVTSFHRTYILKKNQEIGNLLNFTNACSLLSFSSGLRFLREYWRQLLNFI